MLLQDDDDDDGAFFSDCFFFFSSALVLRMLDPWLQIQIKLTLIRMRIRDLSVFFSMCIRGEKRGGSFSWHQASFFHARLDPSSLSIQSLHISHGEESVSFGLSSLGSFGMDRENDVVGCWYQQVPPPDPSHSLSRDLFCLVFCLFSLCCCCFSQEEDPLSPYSMAHSLVVFSSPNGILPPGRMTSRRDSLKWRLEAELIRIKAESKRLSLEVELLHLIHYHLENPVSS